MRTEGFCSAPLRSRDIRDKVRNGILALFRDQLYFSATKLRRTKSFRTHVYNTSNNTSTKLQLQRIKLHIEIVNLKPVTPTTIRLPPPPILPISGLAKKRLYCVTAVKGVTLIYNQEKNIFGTFKSPAVLGGAEAVNRGAVLGGGTVLFFLFAFLKLD